jgi:alpha-mannosidase
VSTAPVFLVPHTHWDREWYEPESWFRQRLTILLDRLLSDLESGSFPGPFVLDGQTILLRDYLRVRPEAAGRVAAMVRSGRLLAGPWFALADELLSSDEALVRNLQLGTRDAEALGGVLRVGYSPDAFGHPATLPAILTGFGISNAILWRGAGGWDGVGDLFEWRAADGARVLVHHLPQVGYEVGTELLTGEGGVSERWQRLAAMLEPRSGGRPLLVPAGADHWHHSVELPKIVGTLARRFPERRFTLASPAAYFEALVPDATVPSLSGELRESYGYTWVLQGTHAVRAPLKAAIAEGDRLLRRWAEPLAALAWMAGGDERRALLDDVWRLHLSNCLHDTICGCTVDVVAEDAALRARAVAVQARGIVVDALHERLQQRRPRMRDDRNRWRPVVALVNPSTVDRSGVCEVTVTLPVQEIPVGFPPRRAPRRAATREPLTLLDARGDPVALQVLGRYRAYERIDSAEDYPVQREVEAVRVAICAPVIPALGNVCLAVAAGAPAARVGEHPVRARGGRITAGERTITADADGGFVVAIRGRTALGELGALTSEADRGDTYTFQPVERDAPVLARWSRARTSWNGPIVAAVFRDFDLGRAKGRMYARADAGSPLLRFVVEGVNLSGNHRLRMHFPLPATCEGCLVDMQYGPVWRARSAPGARTAMEWTARTAPMHGYVSIPNGLTMFARGLFEYELTAEGTLALTLFRAVGDLSRSDLPARPGHAAWPRATPGAQLVGPFRVELAVAMVGADPDTPDTVVAVETLADAFHAPLAGLMLPAAIDPPDAVPGPRLEGTGLVFKALKPSADGRAVILRCVNMTAYPVEGAWILPWLCAAASLARLDETPEESLPLVDGGRRLRFTAAPRAIVTVRLER